MVVTPIGRAAMLLALGLLLTGCGGSAGPTKYKVIGKVTFAGEDVQDGRITFRGEGEKIGNYSAPIVEGRYAAECEPGAYKVEITASRMTGKFVTTIEGKSEVGEMYIPEKYNSQTTLTKEVAKGGGEIDFDLTK
jgi:hypothetical protein